MEFLEQSHQAKAKTSQLIVMFTLIYAVADRVPRVYPWVNEPDGDTSVICNGQSRGSTSIGDGF